MELYLVTPCCHVNSQEPLDFPLTAHPSKTLPPTLEDHVWKRDTTSQGKALECSAPTSALPHLTTGGLDAKKRVAAGEDEGSRPREQRDCFHLSPRRKSPSPVDDA